MPAERRAGLQWRHRRVEEDALLVDDLDEGDGRVLGVGQAGVRILMLEQVDHLADLHLLQLGRVVDRAVRRRDAVLSGIELAELGLRQPTLDDVFLSITGHVTEESDLK